MKHSISKGARAPRGPARRPGLKVARRHRQSWSAAEDRLLGRQPDAVVARRLGRSIVAVQGRRWHLGLFYPQPARWTKAEDRLLGRQPDAVVARRLGRSVGAVQSRRLKLGLRSRPNRRWTKAEERLVGRRPDAEVAGRLGRSLRGVEGRRLRLGLRQYPNLRWTKAEERLLAQAWKRPRRRTFTRELSQQLGRSQVAVETHRRLRFGRVQRRPRPWTRREERLLGTRPDKEIAKLLDRDITVVLKRRHELGIPSAFWRRRNWTPAEDRRLGTAPDGVLARKLGCTCKVVQHRRSKLGIAPFASPWAWTPEEDRLLGTEPDGKLARRLGRSLAAVQVRRIKRRIPSALPAARRWTPREDALLGTKTDAEVGRLLGRGTAGVRRRRTLLHIRLTQWRTGNAIARSWTQAELELLGRLPDSDVAEQLGRSVYSVVAKRMSLRRPACRSQVRRVRQRRVPSAVPSREQPPAGREWTMEEELLLGSRPDREVARRLRRSQTSVAKKRRTLGLPAFGRQS